MIFGDLGRYPVYITSAVRCVKYWYRIINLPDERLPKKAYKMLLHLQNLGKKTWVHHVGLLLCENGFQEVWNQQSVGDLSAFLCLFRTRLIDKFQQDWSESVSTSERFEFYSSFKTSIVTEKYFDYVQLRCFREAYVRFRFGISPILVHKLRYKSGILPRNLLCPACKQEVEDEEHVLFSCMVYEEFRRDLPTIRNDNDVTHIMKADDEDTVIQLSWFLYKAFTKRNDYLINVP